MEITGVPVLAVAEEDLCSFCQATTASVMVQLPSLRSKKNKTIATPFCLLHYYTTSACRVGGTEHSNVATIINESALQAQMSAQQELFAEAFVQLQQELSDVALTQHAKHKDDPLAILSDLHQSSSKRQRGGTLKAPPIHRTKTSPEGGFLRKVPIPERLLRTQQQQWKNQQLLTARMNKAASLGVDTTQRRKPSRQSVWNVMTDQRKTKAAPRRHPSLVNEAMEIELADGITCSCGSDTVETLSSSASQRNQDMAKAETWGSKDRACDVVTKYRCGQCGKTWNEQS